MPATLSAMGADGFQLVKLHLTLINRETREDDVEVSPGQVPHLSVYRYETSIRQLRSLTMLADGGITQFINEPAKRVGEQIHIDLPMGMRSEAARLSIVEIEKAVEALQRDYDGAKPAGRL